MRTRPIHNPCVFLLSNVSREIDYHMSGLLWGAGRTPSFSAIRPLFGIILHDIYFWLTCPKQAKPASTSPGESKNPRSATGYGS